MTVQERNAEIVRLYVDEKLTIRAIADRLGVPVGTVSGRLSQARHRGDVPYRRANAAVHAFGRRRSRYSVEAPAVPTGAAATAADILASVNDRIEILETELAKLRAIQRTLKDGS